MLAVKDSPSTVLSAPPNPAALAAALANAFSSADFSSFLPLALPIDRRTAVYENKFVSGDGTLSVGDASSHDRKNAFTLMMFPARDLNLPYLSVTRNGDVDVSTSTNGQRVQFESIDFDGRFTVRANDRRSAVMLIDQGMMQWLLDCDHLNFQVWGGLVFGFVRRHVPQAAEPLELELLFRFYDGLPSHVPEIVHSEFPSPRPRQGS
jgi:hypothetical protein